MSLLSSFYEEFCIIEETKTSDGAGGFITVYKDGATFNAAVTLDTTMEARVAEKDGVSSVYTVTTPKSCVLSYNDKIKRASDGQKFRITSNGSGKATPSFGTLDMRQVTAERWEATT